MGIWIWGYGYRVINEQKVLEIIMFKVYYYQHVKCHTQHHLYENSESRCMTEELKHVRTIIRHTSMHF